MNINVLGGAIAASAFLAIVVFHGMHHDAPKAIPVPPAKVEIKAAAPQPAKPKPAHRRPLPKKVAAPGLTYHRVLKGGKIDGTVKCKAVRAFVAGKTPAQLAALQKEYEVSGAQLREYEACLN